MDWLDWIRLAAEVLALLIAFFAGRKNGGTATIKRLRAVVELHSNEAGYIHVAPLIDAIRTAKKHRPTGRLFK